MSGLRKVFSDSAFTALRNILALARGLAVIPIITNLLGEGSYGVWVTLFAVLGLLSSTGGLHLHGSLVRYTSKESKNNQTYSDVLFLTLCIGAIIAIVVSLVGIYTDLSQLLEGELGDQVSLVLLSSIFIISTMFFQINANLPRANGYVKLYDFINIVKLLIETVVLITVFLLGGGIVEGLAALVAVSILINATIFLISIMKLDIPAPNVNNFQKYLYYGIPVVPKTLSSNLLGHTDKYLLLYFMGPTAVGIYAVAKAISNTVVYLTKIFDSTLYPVIASEWDKGNFDEISKIYTNIFRFYTIIGLPSVVGVVVLAEPLLSLISTQKIAQEGLKLVPILLLGYFLRGYDNTIRYIITSAEKTSILGGAVSITFLLNIILNILLIPKFGLIGASIATFLSHFVLFAIITYYSFRLVDITVPALTFARASVSALLMGAVLLYIDIDVNIYWNLLIYPIVGIVIFFTILIVLGEFSKSELNYPRKVLFSFWK